MQQFRILSALIRANFGQASSASLVQSSPCFFNVSVECRQSFMAGAIVPCETCGYHEIVYRGQRQVMLMAGVWQSPAVCRDSHNGDRRLKHEIHR